MEQDQDKIKKQYILHYVLRPDLISEEELHGRRTAVNAKVEAVGGKVEASLCQDSARRLAYPIKKTERGYFCETAFLLEPEGVKTLYENLRLEPYLLRYVIESKNPPAKIKPRRKAKTELHKKTDIAPLTPPLKSEAPTEKISIEELDKKLDEIIKNI